MIDVFMVHDGLDKYFEKNMKLFINAFGGFDTVTSIMFEEFTESSVEIRNYLTLFSVANINEIDSILGNLPSRMFITTTYIDIIDYLKTMSEDNDIEVKILEKINTELKILDNTISSDESLYLKLTRKDVLETRTLSYLTATIFYLINKYYLQDFITRLGELNGRN